MSNVTAFPFVRNLEKGMGQAVAERTILRKKPDGSFETWEEVAHRVAFGNSSLVLDNDPEHASDEYQLLGKHIAKASILMSGRHLQHGDETERNRNQEVFTNCSTAASSYILFYLLLNGSGVGRCYDDDLILVDWDNAPNLRVVLSNKHPDFDWSAHEDVRDAEHKYGKDSKNVMWFKVPDNREGWAQGLEIWENAAFEKIHKDKMLILDFSEVRCKGSPIGGMQNRPASGPVPLMNAFMKAASLKGSGISPWKQAMYIDHYFSECVLVGGARRAARMSTKIWTDKEIIDFVRVKRPIEFQDLTPEQIIEYRKTNQPYGFLWSSNNSVAVDKEFWALLELKRGDEKFNEPLAKHARKLWKELISCSYADGTGEPGIINVDMLHRNDEGWEKLTGHSYAGSQKYQIREETEILMSRLAKRAKRKKYNMIVNPCVAGDTVIATLKGPKTFRELAETENDVLVYAWHPATKLPVVRMMRRPHKTGHKDVLEVEFDSGLKVKMTHDHHLYNFRGQKVMAKDLKVGQSIRAFSMSITMFGHLRVHAWDSEKNSACHQWVHRMVWENENGPIPEGMVIHHLDENPENNVTENMELITPIEHNSIHYTQRYENGFDGTCPNHKVVAIKEMGSEDVYNGCVDDAHTYIILDPTPVAGILSGIVSANCGEIALSVLGGYCVIADVVPFFCDSLAEVEEAFRVATRALIRVNTMDSFYKLEVERTNRIGVGMTGVHEFAWKFFRVGFRDLINPDFEKYATMEEGWEKNSDSDSRVRAASFWRTLEKFNAAVKDEATKYAKFMGMSVPHTMTTIKPAGTTSKLFGLTEGWHLPSMLWYLRWVQFRSDDPLVMQYAMNGYPVRELRTYEGTTIVGFPTAPLITTLGMEDKLVTAAQATPEEQYRWIQLGERHWISGNGEDRGNQISYTLKYDPSMVDLKQFAEMVRKYQKTVRCCSVMPQENQSSFEYLPEEAISKVHYEEISRAIQETLIEDIGKEHLECDSGACPIFFKEVKEEVEAI